MGCGVTPIFHISEMLVVSPCHSESRCVDQAKLSPFRSQWYWICLWLKEQVWQPTQTEELLWLCHPCLFLVRRSPCSLEMLCYEFQPSSMPNDPELCRAVKGWFEVTEKVGMSWLRQNALTAKPNVKTVILRHNESLNIMNVNRLYACLRVLTFEEELKLV